MIDTTGSNQLLGGLRVLVTRPAARAAKLSNLIQDAGGIVVRFPTLEIVGCADNERTFGYFQRICVYDWVIFISVNAVYFSQKAYNVAKIFPARVKVAAIGRATAQALCEIGINVDLVPKQPFNSEALLETDDMKCVKGLKCLVVRGKGGRELLAECLRKRGAEVNFVEVYRRMKPKIDMSSVMRSWHDEGMGVVTVTSGEVLDNLVSMMGPEGLTLLRKTPLLVISPRLKAKALAMGITHVMLAREASDAGIYAALCKFKALNTCARQFGDSDHNGSKPD